MQKAHGNTMEQHGNQQLHKVEIFKREHDDEFLNLRVMKNRETEFNLNKY